MFITREISRRQQDEQLYLSFKRTKISGKKIFPQNVFLGILFGSLLLSSITLIDFINRGGSWQDRNIRAIVPGSDYNWLSTYGVLCIPIIVYCGITSRVLWGKIFSYITLVVALAAHVASYTRAGWLASGVQFFSWGLILRRQFFLMIFVILFILVSVVLLVSFQMGYHVDTLGIWTVETRFQVWKLGLNEMIRHPLVGIGYGNEIFQPVLIDSPMRDTPMHLHNAPLMVGVGSGFPGLLLFLWVFIRLGWELFPKKYPRNWTDTESLKLCFGIVLVGFFFRNLFDYMFAGSLAYLFWILMACGLETSVKTEPSARNHLTPDRERRPVENHQPS